MNLSTIFKPAQFTSDGTLLFFRDVTGGINRIDIRVRYINLPWEERKSFYVRLNSAGTPHTREQLLAAMAA